MRCPSCRAVFAAPREKCAHCGLTLAALDRKFGFVPRYSRYLTDKTQRLSVRELNQLRDALRLFQRKFPQLLFSVMLINLWPRGAMSEYAFWLINRARFTELQATGSTNFELLLVIDPEAAEATLITGYGLENYLSEDDLEAALNAARPGLEARDFARAISNCIDFTTGRLRQIAMQIEGQSSSDASPIPQPAAETS